MWMKTANDLQILLELSRSPFKGLERLGNSVMVWWLLPSLYRGMDDWTEGDFPMLQLRQFGSVSNFLHIVLTRIIEDINIYTFYILYIWAFGHGSLVSCCCMFSFLTLGRRSRLLRVQNSFTDGNIGTSASCRDEKIRSESQRLKLKIFSASIGVALCHTLQVGELLWKYFGPRSTVSQVQHLEIRTVLPFPKRASFGGKKHVVLGSWYAFRSAIEPLLKVGKCLTGFQFEETFSGSSMSSTYGRTIQFEGILDDGNEKG